MPRPGRRALGSTLLLIALGVVPGETEEIEDPTAHLAAGHAALAKQSWAQAQKEFTSALWIDPHHPGAHCGLGHAQMSLQQYAAAAESFANCKRRLERLFSRVRTAATRAEKDRVDALQDLRDYIGYLESSERRFKSQGEGSHFSDITRAEGQMNQLRRDQGAQPLSFEVPAEVSFSLGSAQLQAGRLEEAEASLREALATRPDFGAAHNNLAVVYLKKGRVTEAQAAVESAEECGFEVHPLFKRDLERAAGASRPRE